MTSAAKRAELLIPLVQRERSRLFVLPVFCGMLSYSTAADMASPKILENASKAGLAAIFCDRQIPKQDSESVGYSDQRRDILSQSLIVHAE
jgi:hypothetical protein